MKKTNIIKIYSIFWIIAISWEVGPWITDWQPDYTKMAIVNIGLLGILFFAIHLTALKLAKQTPIINWQKELYRKRYFWLLLSLPFIFLIVSWVSDNYILQKYYDKNLAFFALRRFKNASVYMIVPFFVSGLLVYKNQVINGLRMNYLCIKQEKIIAERTAIALAAIQDQFKYVHDNDTTEKSSPSYLQVVRDKDESLE
jgi:hypothetical protein